MTTFIRAQYDRSVHDIPSASGTAQLPRRAGALVGEGVDLDSSRPEQPSEPRLAPTVTPGLGQGARWDRNAELELERAH